MSLPENWTKLSELRKRARETGIPQVRYCYEVVWPTGGGVRTYGTKPQDIDDGLAYPEWVHKAMREARVTKSKAAQPSVDTETGEILNTDTPFP